MGSGLIDNERGTLTCPTCGAETLHTDPDERHTPDCDGGMDAAIRADEARHERLRLEQRAEDADAADWVRE